LQGPAGEDLEGEEEQASGLTPHGRDVGWPCAAAPCGVSERLGLASL